MRGKERGDFSKVVGGLQSRHTVEIIGTGIGKKEMGMHEDEHEDEHEHENEHARGND